MREAPKQELAWGPTPAVMLSASATRQTQKAQQNVARSERPPRKPIEIRNEDEKWVLEALYKRLPSF